MMVEPTSNERSHSMLRNTFCHLPKIGPVTESKLWNAGIHDWDHFLQSSTLPLSKSRIAFISRELEESQKQLANGNPHYFVQHLPVNQYWRLFPHFRDTIAYLDIETTGLENWCNEIRVLVVCFQCDGCVSGQMDSSNPV